LQLIGQRSRKTSANVCRSHGPVSLDTLTSAFSVGLAYLLLSYRTKIAMHRRGQYCCGGLMSREDGELRELVIGVQARFDGEF
jgi:hypothetical protein